MQVTCGADQKPKSADKTQKPPSQTQLRSRPSKPVSETGPGRQDEDDKLPEPHASVSSVEFRHQQQKSVDRIRRFLAMERELGQVPFAMSLFVCLSVCPYWYVLVVDHSNVACRSFLCCCFLPAPPSPRAHTSLNCLPW